MGEHIRNDRIYNIRLGVHDHDVLTPDEVAKAWVRDFAEKVVRRRKQRDAVGNRAAHADIETL